MSFFALSTSALLGIFGAVAAATVALYVLKLRRRPVAVPFSPIWQRVLREKDASQLFSRLKNLISLLLQLVLLALVVLALGDPRRAAGASEGRNVVVLVDTSASMQAVDLAPTRLDAAKKKVTELVSGLSASDRMLVAKMDASTVPMTTMTSEPAELNEGVERLVATDTRADLSRGVAFALDALRGASHPEIVLISDGALDAQDVAAAAGVPGLDKVPVRFVPIGRRGKNVAVTEFSVRRYPLDSSRYEVLLEVANTNDAPADVELTLLGDGEVVDVSRFTLKPKEHLPRVYSELGGASRTLEAKVRLAAGADDLPADDRAYALMPERRRAKVQVVSRGNTYLDAALLLDEYLDVTNVTPAEYHPNGAYDVTIFDGVAPAAPEHGSALYLNPPLNPQKDGGLVKVGKELANFGFDTWDRKSPILRFMAVENVQVAKGHALVPDKADHVVGASELGPILVSGRRDGRAFVTLGFDPRDSDLVLRPAWPLFVLNVIRNFVEDDSSYLSSYRTGVAWKIPVPGDAPLAFVKDPLGVSHEVPVKEGRAAFFGERAGFYEVSLAPSGGGSGGPVSLFAANLGEPEESNIEPEKELRLGGKPLEPVSGFTAGIRNEIWINLVIAALLLSLFEWFAYHRRVTV